MGRCRERGTVRNSRFSACFDSKVWRQRRSFRARSASVAKPFRGVVPLLQSRTQRRCFREPRFWSLAGHPSQNRKDA